jgi:hypothetical protein
MSQCDSAPKENVCHESHDKVMTYVPKSTNNPSTPQHVNDAGDDDAHMQDETAEEEKVTTQPSKNKQHVGSKKHVTWANQDGAELTDSTQGVNKRKKQ